MKIDKEMLLSKANSMMSKIDNAIEDSKSDNYEKAVKPDEKPVAQ